MYRYTYGTRTAVSFIFKRQRTDLPMHIGATFADLQPVPNLGAWHGSECKSSMSHVSQRVICLQQLSYLCHFVVPILFGTFNRSTATSAEVELSQSLQTAFANFAKNPNSSPAPHWPPYEPEVSGNASTATLAKIAYQGNVDFDDFVQPVQPDSTVSTRNDDAKSQLVYL